MHSGDQNVGRPFKFWGHGHGAVDDMGHLGVRVNKGEKDKGRIKVTLGMIVVSKNRRYNLQQTSAEFEPNH